MVRWGLLALSLIGCGNDGNTVDRDAASTSDSSGTPAATGHYTQIVWRDTLQVGCARGNCPNITFGNTIVCNYGPGGNIGDDPPY